MSGRLLRVLVIVLVLTACSSDRSAAVEKLQGVPVLEGATRPPGTPLGDGFTVAPGTFLIGDVFPIGVASIVNGRPIEDEGWRAHLLVTGDPHRVIRHYQQEAANAELYLNPDSYSVVAPSPQRRLSFCGEDPFEGYTCGAFSATRFGSETRSFRLWLRRQPQIDGVAPVPQSFLTLAFNTYGAQALTKPPVAVEFGPPPPPLPSDWPPLAAPGGWIPTAPGGYPGSPGGSVPSGLPSRIKVQAGSRVAAPEFANPDCTSAGARAVLLVEADPNDVLTAYRREFVRLMGGLDSLVSRSVDRRRDDGAEVLSIHAGEADDTYGLTVFVRKGRPTWGLIEACLS